MCEKAKGYMSVIREYSREIVMLLGFALAVYVYTDFRTLTRDTVTQQAQTAEILRSLDVRMGNLERDHAAWRKEGGNESRH